MDMKDGYIKLWRQIQGNELWTEKRPKTKAEAWIDIIMEAQHSHEPQKVMIGMIVLECHRGQSLNSLDTWALRWGWSKSKVWRFMKFLQKQGMIETKSAMPKSETLTETLTKDLTTRLTVVNYEKYAGGQNEAEMPSNTLTEMQTKCKRNANETRQEGREGQERKEEEESPPSQFSLERAERFIEIHSEIHPKIKYDLNKQARHIDSLLKKNYSEDDVDKALKFVTQDEFWSDPVQSIAKMLKRPPKKSENHIYKNYMDLFLDKADQERQGKGRR
ncbi:hypothetical protein LCGC14_2045310 [marine sediment metagenome]|uniref:Bacteriophage lambda Replication protein O N-terminal domain-containing protein n=1 Tax=marine sediment metagenome TaxID=412755 RepID=A0A0F9EQS5_9ZZZZ